MDSVLLVVWCRLWSAHGGLSDVDMQGWWLCVLWRSVGGGFI
jgi:hypothetical protein